MSIKSFKYLFEQFINKTYTKEEKAEFLSLTQESSNDDELQKLLDENWKVSSTDASLAPEKADYIFNRIISSNTSRRDTKIRHLWIKAAAAILVIAMASGMLYLSDDLKPGNTKEPAVVKTKQTPLLKRCLVSLPDGSTVILNGNSKLNFDDTFNTNGKREVYLTGEAYFDIKHDPSRPFIVHTGKLRTTVLGTAFDIKAFPGDKEITVTVKRGKVQVSDDKRPYGVIVKDQQIVYNKTIDQHIKAKVNASTVVAWKHDDLYFDDVTMEDIVSELEERFNVRIDFGSDQIRSCRLTGTFLKSQNLKQILEVIGEFNHIRYSFLSEKNIILQGEGCK